MAFLSHVQCAKVMNKCKTKVDSHYKNTDCNLDVQSLICDPEQVCFTLKREKEKTDGPCPRDTPENKGWICA